MNRVRRDGNAVDLVAAVGQLAEAQCDEPLDEENAFSLLAPAGRIAARPSYPDRWMMEDGLAKEFPGRTENVVLPSMPRIVDEYQKTRNTDRAPISKVGRGDKTFWVMRAGAQTASRRAAAPSRRSR